MLNPIKNTRQYEVALAKVYTLMQKQVKANSKESDELEALSVLIKEYENEYCPIPKPDPSKKLISIDEARNLSKKLIRNWASKK